MGIACSMGNQKSMEKDTFSEDEEDDDPSSVPKPLDNIMGIDVDRTLPQYSKALKACTILAKNYKELLFTDNEQSLSTFADVHYLQFRDICNEIFNDLLYEERNVPNNKFGDNEDIKAKVAIDNLAKYFTTMSMDCNAAETLHFEDYYDDTLKLIITDLEGKQFYGEEEENGLKNQS